VRFWNRSCTSSGSGSSRLPAESRRLNLKVTMLGTGTSHGVPMIGCECKVCRSSDPRDRRTRASILIEIVTRPGTSNLQPPTSNLQPPTSNPQPPTSNLKHVTATAQPQVPIPWFIDSVRSVLVDTSTDLRFQALAHSVNRVDAILFTHSHADHIMGI